MQRYFYEKKHLILDFSKPESKAVIFDMVSRIAEETELLLPTNESYNLYTLTKATKKIPGHIAEIGCYRGGSTKIICEAKGDRHIYAYDTFEGLPEKCDYEPEKFHEGRYKSNYEEVKNYLSPYQNVHVIKAVFPDKSDILKDMMFSFVHLDVDLHKYILQCLSFFYPRMTKGGVILIHDYHSSIGVTKAVQQFFEDKQEPVVELPVSQCMTIKA